MTVPHLDTGLIFEQTSRFSMNGFAVISVEDDTLLYLNPALCDMLGYTEEADLIGIPFPELTDRDPHRPSFYRQAADRCKEQAGYMEEIEKRLLHKKGHYIWARLRLSSVREPSTGAARYLCAEMLDITSYKTERLPVLDSRHLYTLLTRNSNDLVSVSTIDGTLLYISPSCYNVIGFTADEMMGQERTSYYHPDDADEMTQPGKLYSDKQFFLRRIRHKDGRFFWFEVWSQVIWDESEQTDKVLTVGRDITERKEYEDKLDEAQRIGRFGTWSLDVLKQEISLSDGSRRILGFAPDQEISSELLIQTIHPEDYPDLLAEWRVAKHGAKSAKMMHRIIRSDGVERTIETQWEVLHLDSGEPSQIIGSIHDVTERREFELKLHESEQRYKSLFEYNPAAVYSMNLKGEYLTANANLEKLTGYTLEELIGMYYGPLLPEREEAKTAHHFGLAGKGEAQNYEVTIINRQGEEIETSVSNIPIIVGGEVVGVFGISNDITDRKRAEAKLFESEIRYKCLFDNNNTAICSFDMEGNFIKVNPAMEALTGYTMEELKKLTFGPLTYEADLEQLTQHVELAKKGAPQTYEARLIAKSGEIKDLSITNVPIVIAGNVVGFYGIATDITENKRYLERIRVLSDEHARILNTVSEGIFGLDREGRFTFINQAGAAMLGFQKDEQMGPSALRMILQTGPDGTHYSEEESPIFRAIREGRVHKEKEAIFWKRSGTSFLAEYQVTPLYDQGERTGAVVVFRDVTGEKEIIEAKESAERADRAKSEFLSTMSHELRTPMNGIIGMTGLLLETDLNEEQRSYADIISHSSEALMHILNEILDFSKIEAGKMVISLESIVLHEAVEDVINLFSTQAADKRIALGSRIDADVPAIITGDPVRLRQVLINLVSNAIKFTESGSVTLFVRAMPAREPGSLLLEFAVQDTGIGIARDKQSQLFQSFSQLHSGLNRKYGGTGLGLAISKKLVELMGGIIGVDSVEGQGSTFRFTLAAKLDSDSQDDRTHQEEDIVLEPNVNSANRDPGSPQAGTPAMFGPLRILLAEDHAMNQQIMKAMLNKWGYETDVVENGEEAVQAVRGKIYDLIFMDVQMPVLDGIEATRRIRLEQSNTNQPVIIALTAFARTEDKEACLACGMQDFLSKPVRLREIEDLLRKWSTRLSSQ